LGKSYLNGWIDEKSSLSKESQVFNPSQFMHFKQKAMGEGLKTANLGRCRIIQDLCSYDLWLERGRSHE
jgi:hypothetical protein